VVVDLRGFNGTLKADHTIRLAKVLTSSFRCRCIESKVASAALILRPLVYPKILLGSPSAREINSLSRGEWSVTPRFE